MRKIKNPSFPRLPVVYTSCTQGRKSPKTARTNLESRATEWDHGMELGDRELTLAARVMIELFGDQASVKAKERAKEYVQAREPNGEKFWTNLPISLG